MRWLTAGESHGQALVGIIEGVPAGVSLTTAEIADALAQRRLGYGRGARMNFEADEVTILSGVRHGKTLGSPISLEIKNTEWPKWEDVMSVDPLDDSSVLEGRGRNSPLTKPRPGHADFAGMQKYGFEEARPVLERASARETAARVALGAISAAVLREVGIETVSHTLSIAEVFSQQTQLPQAADVKDIDANPVRCFDAQTSQDMVARIDQAKKDGQTLGGIVEVIAFGLPPGIGSYAHWDRRLDSRLAGALMGIQAIKGVEVGDGFETARRPGSQAHDEIDPGQSAAAKRRHNRAGGIEGGMSIGDPVRVRAAMKPIATVPRALDTIDITTGQPAKAHHQRSDVCAVPAAGVVAEAMVRLVICESILEKFGGDSISELSRNIQSYLDSIPENLTNEVYSEI